MRSLAQQKTRLRDVGRRRARGGPPPGMTLPELAARANVSLRTARYYREIGLLGAIDRRGTATRYGEEHLARLLAAVALRDQGASLDDLAKRLRALSPEELAHHLASASATRAGAPERDADARAERFALMPGVELVVAADADEATRERVRRLVSAV